MSGHQVRAAAQKLIEILGPCELDHDGYCQSHFISDPCAVNVLRAALEENADGE